jgi:hypothetical protein
MKALIAGLALTVIWGSTQGEASRQINRQGMVYASAEQDANRGEWRQDQCRFQGLDRGIWTQREEDRTARCVLRRWPVLGGLTKFRAVISCESGWWRLAYNAAGPYVGLAQHALTSWYYRVKSYKPTWWDLRPWWANSRSAITITARMVRAEGWDAWSCS